MNNARRNVERIYRLYPHQHKKMLKYDVLLYGMMKDIYKISIGLFIAGGLFLLGIFVNNFLATSIGLIFVGIGANLLMFDMKAKSRSMVYMWVAILLLIGVFLGLQYLIKDLNINIFKIG